jgi:hypothetical protein
MSGRVLSELLPAAAKAFEDQQSPFCTEWLVEHHVTSDECYELSMAISAAISYFEVMYKATERRLKVPR